MKIDRSSVETIIKKYSLREAFYILDSCRLKRNFSDLESEMRRFYPKFKIAYSYKTNYMPRICEIIDELGGWAEIVSDMEYDIATACGVSGERIIFNGPYKKTQAVFSVLNAGGTVNIDNTEELNSILRHRDRIAGTGKVAVRCNYDVGEAAPSRFGIDIDSRDFTEVCRRIQGSGKLKLAGLHAHFASRGMNVWHKKIKGMLDLLRREDITPGYVDVGGGLFGHMADSLKAQFSDDIPSYADYARAIAKPFAEFYADRPECEKPYLFIEPGSALVGDVMYFVAKVLNIKNIRGKNIATVLGSVYNINPTLNGKNPPLEILSGEGGERYENLDIAGYTCIERDYLYRNYSGKLDRGDYVCFGNVGSYSVVLKPPFILPNFAVVEIGENGEIEVVKREEGFTDLFGTYTFKRHV